MSASGAADASEQLRARLKWFLFGRVLVASCFLTGMFLQTGTAATPGLQARHLTLAIIGTYAFSIVSALLLERIARLDIFTFAQITFDVSLVTGVVFMTGGIESPFPFLYSLPIINGAGLLLTRGAAFGTVLSVLTYTGLVVGSLTGVISIPSVFETEHLSTRSITQFISNNATFLLVGVLASVLTRRLLTMENLVRERQSEQDRLNVLQEAIGRTIGSAVIATDTSGRITSADQAAAELVGESSAQMIGRDIGNIFPPLQLTVSARRRYLQSREKMDPTEFSFEVAGKPATHLRCVTDVLRDTYGNPIGILNILQDITRLKELEEQQTPSEQVEEVFRQDLETAAEIAEEADGIYGISAGMVRIRQMIERVAGSDATVLITGESGTGKELVARAIHARSSRRKKPFVAVNCGAIPEALIESEFFGHVKGAFTGAIADRAGCFRAADGGTIFLDEIGELPLHLQVKLLRVLQERVFRPVGSETNIAVNVRVVAATNRNLAAEAKGGRFREDLFYRLNVIAIEIPALRDRKDDIPLLTRRFLQQFASLHHRNVAKVSAAAMRMLLTFDFPGNVRELENIIEHAIALSDSDTIDLEHLPEYVRQHSSPPKSDGIPPTRTANQKALLPTGMNLDDDLAEYEKAIILQALEQSDGVRKRAAEILGINYRSLRHRLQKYGISSGDED